MVGLHIETIREERGRAAMLAAHQSPQEQLARIGAVEVKATALQ